MIFSVVNLELLKCIQAMLLQQQIIVNIKLVDPV